MKKDIDSKEDIQLLVDKFYDKVRQDQILKGIFNRTINDNWDLHLPKMYSFWQTVLLHEKSYSGNPFMPHTKLPINAIHFHRWTSLFNETLNENFEGTKANHAKIRVEKMSEMFQYKLAHLQNRTSDH